MDSGCLKCVPVRLFTTGGNAPLRGVPRNRPRLRGLPVLGLALALLAAAALAPLAGADHVYSHRYVVSGRILDADGKPAVNVSVGLHAPLFRGGVCPGHPREAPLTDAFGDFEYCLHVHEVPEGSTVSILVNGLEFEDAADPALRRSVFHVRLPEALDGEAPPGWGVEYVVEGVVWLDTGPTYQDGVPVLGLMFPEEPVRVALDVDGRAMVADVVTDAFGHYRAAFTLPAGWEAGRVEATAAGAAASGTLSRELMTTFAPVIVPYEEDAADEPAPLFPPPPEERVFVDWPGSAGVEDAPGSAAQPFLGSPAFWILFAAVTAALLATVAYAVRRREVEELERE